MHAFLLPLPLLLPLLLTDSAIGLSRGENDNIPLRELVFGSSPSTCLRRSHCLLTLP